MALQLILGGSGYGKSTYMYEKLIEESVAHPEFNYIVIVPEQYTMQVQKRIVSMHPKRGMLNVDVVSFGRLAYRVFDELHIPELLLLEDIGKSMVLRKVLSSMISTLTVLKGNAKRQGFVSEMKSTISELLQYHVTPEDLKELSEKISDNPLLSSKLKDIGFIFDAFKQEIEERYMTAEELLDRFRAVVPQSEFLKNSYIYMDEFTGFTPSQYKLLSELLKQVRHIQVALTVDIHENYYDRGPEFKLFYLTKDTIYKLEKLCMQEHIEREKDIVLKKGIRFKNSAELAFMERNIYRSIRTDGYGQKLNDIHMMNAVNPSEEMRAVTLEIQKLVRQGIRYREIAVITGDLSVYGHVIERALAKGNIPYFIDSKKSVLANGFVDYVRALLEVMIDDFSYESIFRWLKTGMTDISAAEIDRIENYILAMGIRGYKRWCTFFERTYKGMGEGEITIINDIRERIMAILDPFKKAIAESDHSAGAYAAILTDYLEKTQAKQKVEKLCKHFEDAGELALVKEYSQIYPVVLSILEKAGKILNEERMTLREFSDILDAGFNEAKVGIIPPGLDQVIVGDLRRTRLGGIKILFFVGVNEGIVSGSTKTGGLINDMDKELLLSHHLELSPTSKQDACIDRFYIYTALTKASFALYISYVNVDEQGKTMRPSSLISKIKILFPELEISQAHQRLSDVLEFYDSHEAVESLAEGLQTYKDGHETDEWLRLYLWMRHYDPEFSKHICDAAFWCHEDAKLSKAIVHAIYGYTIENSVTTLEQYASCAYSHFLMYGLRLKERKEYRLAAPDLGIIFHSALELFSSKVEKSEYTWHNMPDDVREELAGESVRETVESSKGALLFDSCRNQFLIKRIERMMKRTVWALQRQLQKGDFVPERCEVRFNRDEAGTVDFKLSDDELLKLRGTIDRVDTFEDEENIYVKIIDYKSSGKKFDVVALYYGLQLQLVVYMDAAMAMEKEEHCKNVVPAGILYYHIDDPIILMPSTAQIKENEGEILSALRMHGLVNDDKDIIHMMDHEFVKESKIIPVAYTNKGEVSKKSSLASTEQFKKLFDFTAQKVKDLGRDILDGHIEVAPYKRGLASNACTYCQYKSVCGFDQTVDGYGFRRLADISAQTVWNEICKEGEKDGDEVDR